MSLTSKITYSNVRLTMRRERHVLAIGSGFIYKKNSKFYIVTAWHNLSGRNSHSLRPLHDIGGLPDNIVVDFPVEYEVGGIVYYSRVPIRISIDDGGGAKYLVHAQSWPRVDVAIIPIDLDSSFQVEMFLSTGEVREYEWAIFAQKSRDIKLDIPSLEGNDLISVPYIDVHQSRIKHTVGDDLFLVGFPAGIVDRHINPIWKRATIATDPSMGWNGQSQFLVDAASRKGMSGCVALYFSRDGNIPSPDGSTLMLLRPVYAIHGVYVGRIGDDLFEAQVGIIWDKKVINDIIDGKKYGISTKIIELDPDKIRETVSEIYPTGADHMKYINGEPALDFLIHDIMVKLNGRANPSEVGAEIRRLAGQKVSSLGG
ncbi:hypothetical protein [Xanthobacter sp. 91]|uniref:hypothetical protein n=1 Tax=Xanthobacter sp. 91 TaxID=1117244 RepID=UPI0012DE9975|nr:hypothetical protein [Xanthobacter sp. 91]